MSTERTPSEKLSIVQKAYITDIIPGIRVLYENTNQVREAFILAHCAILSISGFYAGAKDTNGATYRKFVADFFPRYYEPHKLWKDLRNGLVHGYTFTRTYIVAHHHPETHLAEIDGIMNKRTGLPGKLIVLNFENFLEELELAVAAYFWKVETSQVLLENLCKRYDYAPPVIYVKDREVPPTSLLGALMDAKA